MSQPADPDGRLDADGGGSFDADAIPIPVVSGLVTEDDTPVDDVFSEKQMRLLTEPVFASWEPPEGRRFFLAANVGVFPRPSNDPLVPDVFLSLDTAPKQPFHLKQNRSYFVWEHGKPPDAVIEIVSNTDGEELTRKLRGYERMRVANYVVFDPEHQLSETTLTRFELHVDTLVEAEGPLRLEKIGLGLTLWQGTFEHESAQWLRLTLARRRSYPLRRGHPRAAVPGVRSRQRGRCAEGVSGG